MPQFIIDAIENFWNGQGKALVMTYITSALGFIVLHLHLQGFVSAASLTSWSAVIVGLIGGLLLNIFHHTTSNANVSTTNVTVNQVPNAPAPAPVAALPGASSTTSGTPSGLA